MKNSKKMATLVPKRLEISQPLYEIYSSEVQNVINIHFSNKASGNDSIPPEIIAN